VLLPAVCLACQLAAVAAPAAPPPGTTLYMPLALRHDVRLEHAGIWSATAPAGPQVVLFRGACVPPAPVTEVALAVFADTRYEAWLDGRWVGRGPARFSRQQREYDVFALPDLAAGTHVLAVLVQWAPNQRRAESTRPRLQALLGGRQNGEATVVLATDTHWRAWAPAAWRADAAPVHADNLIGPTEILDLRRLPADWQQPGFDDAAWPAPVPVPADGAVYTPRSIPPLVDAPVRPTLLESGALSPGREVVELPGGTTQRALFLSRGGTVAVESLVDPVTLAPLVARVDGVPLAWSAAGADRPDVVRGTKSVAAGTHTLAFDAPDGGLTYDVSAPDIAGTGTLAPSRHAGRRLLLAEPVPAGALVQAVDGPGLDLVFSATPAYAVLDLGRVRLGRVAARADGPAGAIVDVGWDERLWPGSNRPLPYPGSLHPPWDQVDSWVLDGTTRALSTLDARAGRYLLVAVWGPGPVRLSDLHVLEDRYPASARGAFSSSNARLDRIWQVGVDTLYANMEDAYADPWRERGQWWGDAFVADQVNQAALGDTLLLRRGLRFMGAAIHAGRPTALAPNGAGLTLLDYGMLWVRSLSDYLRQTGDTSSVAPVYPPLRDFMAYLATYAQPDTGLLDMPDAQGPLVYIDPGGTANRYGQATAVNAMYYGALESAATVADALGDPAQAASWRQRAAALRASLNDHLYLTTSRRYAGSLRAGQLTAPTAQAQAWALAYGLVPESEQTAVADALLDLSPPDPARRTVEIYGQYWVLAGLARAGRVPDALTLIEAYYGPLLDAGATTWWESFYGSPRSYASSRSHAWGAAPTWFLTEHVLGARRVDPLTWELRPALAGVSQASGYLPLGARTLRAAWRLAPCQAYTVTVQAPANMAGRLLVPRPPAEGTLTLDDTPLWSQGAPQADNVALTPDGLRVAITPGNHTLRRGPGCRP
jgi:alpha-L-rhamnosidase